MNEQPHRTQIVSFARRGGRLDARQQRAWDAEAGALVLEPPRAGASTTVDRSYVLDATTVFGREAPLVVEIGSGHGDAVIRAASRRPETDFLALEVWRPGVASTLVQIARTGLTNIRLMQVDAAEAVATMLPAGSVAELWLFFPDPWHKTRHRKRRLVTVSFAAQVERVLRPDGVWRLATDWEDYARQMRAVLAAAPGFEVSEGARFEGRAMTKFEKKGLRLERPIHDFTAVKR